LQTRHGCKYGIRVLADLSPISGEQHEDGQTATAKILLVDEIPVRRDDGVEPFTFSGIEQIAVLQRAPAAFVRGPDLVSRQHTPQWRGSALIEQNPHS
jgi:hypothetical protein